MTRLPTASSDVAPLTHRLAVLQLIRALMAAFVVVGTIVLATDIDSALIFAATGLYVLASVGLELLRRLTGGAPHWVLSAMLLGDGVWVAYVLLHGGGPQGALGFLVLFHVVAVTLLMSYRTGLKVAVWHALLLLVVAAIALDHPVGGAAWAQQQDERSLAFHAIALLVVASVTAWCSSLSERALRRGKADLASLVALGDDLERARSIDEVHIALLHHTCERLGFRRAVIASTCPTSVGISGAVRSEGIVTLFEALGPNRLGHRLGHPSSRTPQLLVSLDPRPWPVLDTVLPDAINVVVVPLVAEGLGPALLVAEWGEGRGDRVPAQMVTALAQSATHAALSLRNAGLLAEIETLATRDALTGLVNRRVFDEALVRAVGHAERTDTPLSLVVLDLDRFKAVNDSFGHQVGDEVLRAAGRALTRDTRTEDLAARYGGEEFVVLLPETDGDTAIAIADRLRTGIRDEVHGLVVTVSAGVATMPSDAPDGVALVAAADRALYDAKRSGRDRAVRAGDPIVLAG